MRITVVEPGAVDTAASDHVTNEQTRAGTKAYLASIRQLDPEDVARAVIYAVTQPPHVNVNEIMMRPLDQQH